MYADRHRRITERIWNYAMKNNKSSAQFLSATPSRLKEMYAEQNQNPDFARFRNRVPVFLGIWDDHDYGINDGDRRYEYREESQSIFLDFFNVSKNDPRRFRRGTYHSHVLRKNGLLVKLFLLDVRYHRDPWNDDAPEASENMILGHEQWKWLTSELENDEDIDLAIFVSGMQVLPKTPFVSTAETWAREPSSKRELQRLLVNTQRRGVATLLLSGDVHFSEVNEEICINDDDETYRIAEFTSSGMTHAWQGETMNWPAPPIGPWIFRIGFSVANTIASYFNVNMIRTRGMKFAGRNVGEIEVSRDHVLVRAVDTQGKTRYERQWKMSELRKPVRNEKSRNINRIWCVPQYLNGPTTVHDFEDGLHKLRTRDVYARLALRLFVLFEVINLFFL